MRKFTSLFLSLALAAPVLAHAQFGLPSLPSLPSPTAALDAIKAAAQALATASVNTAAAVQNTSKATVNTIGTAVFDATQTLKSVARNADGSESFELLKGGKPVGRVAVKGGKVVATEVVDAAGKVTSTPVTGARLIVNNGRVSGREILVGGRLIGEEVFDATGKVVANRLNDLSPTAEYVLNKTGEVVLNALSPGVCKAIFAAKNGAQNLVLSAMPGVPGLPTVADYMNRLNSSTAAMRTRFTRANVEPYVAMLERNYAPPEFQRTRLLLDSKKDRVMNELFTEQLICNAGLAAVENKVRELGLQLTPAAGTAPMAPKAGESYFQTVSFSVAGAKYAGGVMSVTFATNFRGQSGLYFSLGAQGAVNIGAGVAVGLGFYPSETLDSMGGSGWGVAASAATAKGYPDIGIDLSMNELFSEPNGFGVSVGYGVGGKMPVDLSLSASYTVPIKL